MISHFPFIFFFQVGALILLSTATWTVHSLKFVKAKDLARLTAAVRPPSAPTSEAMSKWAEKVVTNTPKPA